MSALMVALYGDYDTADRVRTALVQDGFPTDRVELTASGEPGQAGAGPAETLPAKFADYFHSLFEDDADGRYADFLAERVRRGAATITVHPRGDIETNRAREILESAGPVDIGARDLDDQGMERAASDSRVPVVKAILTGRSA